MARRFEPVRPKAAVRAREEKVIAQSRVNEYLPMAAQEKFTARINELERYLTVEEEKNGEHVEFIGLIRLAISKNKRREKILEIVDSYLDSLKNGGPETDKI